MLTSNTSQLIATHIQPLSISQSEPNNIFKWFASLPGIIMPPTIHKCRLKCLYMLLTAMGAFRCPHWPQWALKGFPTSRFKSSHIVADLHIHTLKMCVMIGINQTVVHYIIEMGWKALSLHNWQIHLISAPKCLSVKWPGMTQLIDPANQRLSPGSSRVTLGTTEIPTWWKCFTFGLFIRLGM